MQSNGEATLRPCSHLCEHTVGVTLHENAMRTRVCKYSTGIPPLSIKMHENNLDSPQGISQLEDFLSLCLFFRVRLKHRPTWSAHWNSLQDIVGWVHVHEVTDQPLLHNWHNVREIIYSQTLPTLAKVLITVWVQCCQPGGTLHGHQG